MPDESKTKLRLEICARPLYRHCWLHKADDDEQSEALHELNPIVGNTEMARDAEAAGQLVSIRRLSLANTSARSRFVSGAPHDLPIS
jgi:hypothetical protein